MIHQLRRAGVRAAMRNGTVMRNGVYEKYRDAAAGGPGQFGKASADGEGSGKRGGSVITLRPITVMGRDAADSRDRRDRRDRNTVDPEQLRLSREIDVDGRQVVSVAGELDIATAQQAYAYISDVIDNGKAPVSVDLGEVTFCDASGLGVLARAAKHARQTGQQLMLTSARPSTLKIIRITGLDTAFPELSAPALAHHLS
ncbi:MAG TPA: STAS domain-containing protein [Streptosporangiaceae bacterium]